MSDALTLAWAVGMGVVLGAILFGGLWWTIRLGAVSRRPALVFVGSVLVRTSITLAGFYFVAAGHWDRLLACLLGFVIARLVVTTLTGPPVVPQTSASKPAKEADHASQSR